jgi:uncharacterized protein (DUF1684 family)
MSSPENPFALAAWRRTVAAQYAQLRVAAGDRRAQAQQFRNARDELFRTHEESPIPADRRARYPGVPWYAYDPAWRVQGILEFSQQRSTFEIVLASDGVLRCTRVARVHFAIGSKRGALNVYWIEGYGGGLWLPFADATNGGTTYGGGRYLYDTIKGADLGVSEDALVLDFNYAYNPSCAYDERWSCPLSPPENRLSFAVEGGEKAA